MAIAPGSYSFIGGAVLGNNGGKQFVLTRSDMTTAFTDEEYNQCINALMNELAVAVNFGVVNGILRQAQLVSKTNLGALTFSCTRKKTVESWTVAASSPHTITHDDYDVDNEITPIVTTGTKIAEGAVNGQQFELFAPNGDQVVLVRSDMTSDFTDIEYQDCVDAVTAGKAVCIQFTVTGTTIQSQLTQLTGSGDLVFEFNVGAYRYRYKVDAAEGAHTITRTIFNPATAYIPMGEATVATLNALSGQENGELYTMTDAGTLTDGSLAVVAGDTVAWDATNSVWYKAMDYAPRQYGTNDVHNLPTAITAFRTGDYIAVDGTSGTAKMSKDALISQVAPNNKTQVYITNRGSLFYEESNASLGSIYIKAINGGFAVRGSLPSRTYNMSELAAALGVSLVASPSGVSDCIEIADARCLVLDSGNNFAIKERTAVDQNDVVIIACIEGNVCAYNSQAFGYVVVRRLRDNDTAIKGVRAVLGETTNSTNYHPFEAGITSGFWLGPNQKISVGDFVKIHVQSSSGVLKYRVYPQGTGTGKPSYDVDVSDDFEFASDTAFTAGSKIIQMYIDGLEKDGQGDVVGGDITFEIEVSTKIVSDVKSLLKNDASQDSRLSSVETTATALDDKNTRKRIQFYANGNSNIYVEESRANLGKVWIKSTSDMWAGRLGVNWNYTNATLATALGKNLETSPKGVAGCIPIGDGDNIVITASKVLACKNRNNVLDSDVVVFACLDGKFRGFDSVIFGQLISDQLSEIRGLIGDASNPFYFADTGWMTKQETFCELFNGVSLCDAFLFFTDPHFMGAVDWSNNTKNYVEIIRKWYDCTPTDFIVCGGDWLQNNDTQAIALSKLGFIDGIMNHTFDKYYPILGNHDTNYQGVVSADDASRGDLPQGTLNSIWFNRVGGKSYYDFKARATKFYVFDSGIDWTADVVSEYEWEQVAWFANKLLAGSDEHIGLMLHLISNNASEIQPVAFAQTLLDIAYAFNSRASVTRHGITYDFASATGYVEFMLGGHTHSDLNATFHDIPIVITTRVLTPGTNPTFDLVLVDYTNNKLQMVRIGSGSDREFNLYSASLS